MVQDYYKLLNVSPHASFQEIRRAYKLAALNTHPDRVSPSDRNYAARTRQFQEVNDAYFTLSDPARRREYDASRRTSGSGRTSHAPDPAAQWSDAFEEMMEEEGLGGATTAEEATSGTGGIYSIVGGLGGAALGFIVGNVPGLLVGAAAGGTLGKVRDKKGKSVYEVFLEMPQAERAALLMQLAARLLGSQASGTPGGVGN